MDTKIFNVLKTQEDFMSLKIADKIFLGQSTGGEGPILNQGPWIVETDPIISDDTVPSVSLFRDGLSFFVFLYGTTIIQDNNKIFVNLGQDIEILIERN